jgi:hypothetical protein
MKNFQIFEDSAIFNQTPSKTLAPRPFGPTNNATQAYTSPPTLNNIIFNSPPSALTASSSPTPCPTGLSEHEKSELLCAVFESQPHTASPVPTIIEIALKTRTEVTSFIETHQKLEKSAFFTQNLPETLVSISLDWEDGTKSLPAPSTIVTTLKTCQATAGFIQKRPKMRKSTNFNQIPSLLPVQSLISDHYNWKDDTEPLAAPLILPTKHPCVLSCLRFHHF